MEISLFLKLTVLSVIVSFVLIQILNNKENLYLNAANPGTKKLMVVDQTTGAITFLDESVQGIDQALASNDSAQSTLLKSLFGANLDGTAGVFKTKMEVLEKRLNVLSCGTETCTAGREEKSPGTPTTYQPKGDYIKNGSRFNIESEEGLAGPNGALGNWRAKSQNGMITNFAPNRAGENNSPVYASFGSFDRGHMRIHSSNGAPRGPINGGRAAGYS